MTTADMALKLDPEYAKISKHFYDNPDEFADAYAHAWFKLTHRDMGPINRYLGEEVPAEELLWQDPVPLHQGAMIGAADISTLKQTTLDSGLTTQELVGIGCYLSWLRQSRWCQRCSYPPCATKRLAG